MAGRNRAEMEECKMFVGGLTRDTTADMLKGYFSYYGRVVHAVVMTNPETQKSRGFGFVAFERPEIVDRVIMSGPHFLDGKQIDPKPSVPKDLRPKPPQVEQPKKAFLGGLPLEMNEADLREFFSRYGVVTECYIMYDEKRMKSRGFGFVSFEDDSIVDDLVSQHYIDVRDKKVEVKLARPRENPLAPLNSEGRVFSADVQQQRIAAAAAASAHAQSRPPAPYHDPYNYYPPMVTPYRQPPWHYNEGAPAPKRLRIGARTPPPYASTAPSDYYRGYDYPYGGYEDRSAAYSDRLSPPGTRSINFPVDHKTASPPMKPISATSATGVAGTSALAPFPSATSQSSSVAMDPANMTPESMNSLMQQAMQNMGGVGMNMMMPMFMSNMMTQMFMNQAQTMFQSMMQQRKSDQPEAPGMSKSDGQSSGSPADVMEVMKNVLQKLMTTMQQQQDGTAKSE